MIYASVPMHELACAECSTLFAITTHFDKARREDHATFYCPKGHNNYYSHKTESEKLKAQLESEQRRNNNLLCSIKNAENVINGQKALNSRLKNKLEAAK